MDVLDWINDSASWMVGGRTLLIAAALTLFMYFVLKKKDEFGDNAIRNTAATIVVTGINLFCITFFTPEINAFAQAAYARLGVPKLDPAIWAGTPLWLQCILGLAVKDLADYANHRLMHTKWLWPTHAAHHSDTHVNAFTSYRVHFLEAVLMSLSYIVLLTWLQMPGALPIVVMLGLVHNMYVHLDLEIGHGPLKYLIASPVFHRWHHADVPEAYGKNLANIMPIYDVIFGTYYMPGVCREKLGALSSGIEDKNPIQIWLYPFREWARLIRQSAGRWTTRKAPRDERPGHPTNVTPAE